MWELSVVEINKKGRVRRQVERKGWQQGKIEERNISTEEPLLYDHPQNHIGVVV